MVNLQADASLSVAAAGLTSGLPYVLPWFLDTNSQNLNTADLNVIGTALRAEVQLDITVATLTAEAIRNAMVDSTLALTATIPATDVGRTAQVDATLAVTASSFESTPVAYDATGTGADSGASTTTSLSWSHTATAGADVFAFVLRGGNNVTVTHDGVAMSYVTAISLNNDPDNGTLYIFRRAAVPGGTKTVAVTFSGATYCSANSVSYLNVGVVKLASTYATAALTASHTIAGADKSIIVSALGQHCGGVDTFVSASGGTLRDQQMGSAKYFNLVIQDSTSTGSVTFSSTVTATNTVSGGVGMILSPPPPTSTHVKTVELLSTVSTGAQPNANSINWNHTIESDATLLVVAWGGLSTQFYTSVTVNGQAMTKVGDWAWVVNGYIGWINYHVYLMPPSGVQNIVISGGGTGAYMSATSLTFRNAKAVGAMIYGTNGVVSGQGPNDFLLNVVSGWVDGQAGFTGYNQNLIFADLSTTGEPALFGYARGSAATFNISNLLANYGGWGNAILPIKPMIDAQGDSTLAASATISSAGVLARQSDVTMAITAAIPANSVRTAQIDATQAITASRSGAIIVDLHGNATMPTTAAPTGGALRNANVDAPLAITASRPSNVTWTTMFDVAQAVTATPTSIGSYGATAAVAQTITASRPANITWQLKANVAQPITATITADSLRNANVNATLAITASRDTNVTWVLAANVAQTITATLQASELRLVNVDAALAVTAGYLGLDTVTWDSTGAGATGAAGGGTKVISWSHTIGPQANCVVVAAAVLIAGATPNVSATCGAASMTNVGMVQNWDTSPGNYSTVFFMLKNPPTGVQTISFSSTDGTASYLVANSVAYRNVGSYEFLATNNGNGTSLTQGPLGSSASRMIVQAFANNTVNVSITGYSQTQRWSQQGVTNVNACMVIGDAPGAASVSFAASCATSAKWGAVALSLTPMPVAQVGIAADSAQTATASPTTTYLRNAIVNATQQIIANRTGAIVVDLHGNATLPVTTTDTGVGVRNAMVDSTIAVTASRTANSNWYAYADATQTITPRGLGLETVSPPTWVGTGPGKSQGTSPLTYTDTIPVGTTYTLLFGQLLCASATLPTVSATIGGVTATLVDSVYISSNSGNYLYGVCLALANPPTGSQTVSFTSNSILACAVNTVHYSGVGSLGPVSKIGQQAGQPSFSVGTDAKYGYAQAFFYAAAAGNGFSSYNQNQRWTISAVLNVNGPLLIGDATGNGGTLTFSATRDNTTNNWGAMVVPLAPTSAGAIYGATAATALPITATRLANVTWAAKAAALQQVTASPAAEYSRGQPASATQSITAIPDSTGSRGQTVESTETITVSTDAIGSRGQGIDSPLVVTADLLSMVTWQGWFDAAQVITASDTANTIWALRANAAQQITASHTALASYGATGNALLPITASPTGHVIWDAHALSALIVTASTSTIGSRWQPIDSTQAITALLSGVGSRGQFVDSTLGLTITALPAAISYGATGNAPLVITANLLTSDTLLDNHAYAALVVNAGRPTSVIWDTRADSRLTVTTHFWATFGRLLNVDASLMVTARLPLSLKATLLSNAELGLVAGLPTRLSRGQTSDAAQAIVMTPAGGIVWHGVIGAPLRITATLPGNAVWDAHANSQLIVTESGLVVPSRGQSIDPALEVTADASADYTQTMSGDVEQAILALPDTELSLGSTMDTALPLIVTYSADIGEALRGGNFFYFYL